MSAALLVMLLVVAVGMFVAAYLLSRHYGAAEDAEAATRAEVDTRWWPAP